MARNGLAGTKKGTSKSAKYFQEHPEARAKKDAYNKAYHASEKRVQYREDLNQANRKAGTYGKMTEMHKDRSHLKNGKMVAEDSSKNRARNGKNGRSSKK